MDIINKIILLILNDETYCFLPCMKFYSYFVKIQKRRPPKERRSIYIDIIFCF